MDELFPQSLVSLPLVMGAKTLGTKFGSLELEQGDVKSLISGGILEQCYKFGVSLSYVSDITLVVMFITLLYLFFSFLLVYRMSNEV